MTSVIFPSGYCKGYGVMAPRCPADMPFQVVTVGLCLYYSDFIWQAVLSHLKRLLPLKSQVLCARRSHPKIARDLRQRHLRFICRGSGAGSRWHSHPSRCSRSICQRVRREYLSLSSLLSPSSSLSCQTGYQTGIPASIRLCLTLTCWQSNVL